MTDENHEIKIHCRKCSAPNVTRRVWESSDGAYEDYEYSCPDCEHVWWIEGPDA